MIFRNARKEQLKNRMQYEELYHTNYYKEVKEKNRVYYEYYCLDRTEEVPADYKEISFVCLRPDGCLELPTTLGLSLIHIYNPLIFLIFSFFAT